MLGEAECWWAVESTAENKPGVQSREIILLASVFVVAVAGLIYELIAGTLSTYLLGSSVTVFSVVIGLFLSAMGLGAYVAQFVTTRLVRTFITAEILLAAVGGTSALTLYASFVAFGGGYKVVLGVVCLTCGALVGLEIPLLIRILEEKIDVRVAVSHVLALDYAGALIASLAFPLFLLPYLGLVRTSALFGLLNLVVAAAAARVLLPDSSTPMRGAIVGVAAGLIAVLVSGGQATTWLEDQLYTDPVLFSATTPYQRIVVTRWRDDVRLYVEGHLQFSSTDEYRYHESLVHPAMASADRRVDVLILGGGDGLAAREVLRYPEVKRVDLVDLDPEITTLFTEQPLLAGLNDGSLTDPRVHVHNADALKFLEEAPRRWDVIIMDLPDPNDPALSRLYSVAAFSLARQRLADGGALVSQATSPYYAPEAFWCIATTIEAAFAVTGAQVHPYHALVPSFGEWGFVLVAPGSPGALSDDIPFRFLTDTTYQAMFDFPVDLQKRPVSVNHLADAILARYYRDGWMRIQAP
ncbi:MAG: spermidine synthase [Myxococcota bacterium]